MDEINVVEYSEELGTFTVPEGAETLLRGLPLEEQIKFFAIAISSSTCSDREVTLYESYATKALIVKDGIIVGVMMSDDCCQLVPCYIGKSVCTWDASDNNGAGYKSRIDYSELLFVPQK